MIAQENKYEKKILSLLKKKKYISTTELSECIQRNYHATLRLLIEMQNKNLIKPFKFKSWGYWTLANKDNISKREEIK